MSKGKKKVNPRRKPVSAADVKRAKEQGSIDAIKRVWALSLMTLSDKEGYSREALQRFWQEVNDLAESVQEHRISWGDIYHTIYEELGASVEWILPDEWR